MTAAWRSGRVLSGRRWVVLGAAPLLAGTPLLMARMRRDLAATGELRASTAGWMWTAYATCGTLTAAALTAPPAAPRLPPTPRAVGAALMAAGVALDLAALQRFAGPAQLTGTAAGDLVTGGIYRYSRHPQYTGILAALTGLSLTRRSAAGLALTAALAVTYRAWVPIEEAHLTQHFGQPYAHYHASTPRWLGVPRRRGDTEPS